MQPPLPVGYTPSGQSVFHQSLQCARLHTTLVNEIFHHRHVVHMEENVVVRNIQEKIEQS